MAVRDNQLMKKVLDEKLPKELDFTTNTSDVIRLHSHYNKEHCLKVICFTPNPPSTFSQLPAATALS